MKKRNGKWWLAFVAMYCVTTAVSAYGSTGHPGPPLQVPEGGSTAIYLIGAGLTCFGAMVLRSRVAKPAKS
jgi:hypothetical protein